VTWWLGATLPLVMKHQRDFVVAMFSFALANLGIMTMLLPGDYPAVSI